MVGLEEIKNYLKVDTDEDDLLIQGLIEGASQFLVNATGKTEYKGSEKIADTFIMLLVAEWYENREYTGKLTNRIKPIITSMIMQLKY